MEQPLLVQPPSLLLSVDPGLSRYGWALFDARGLLLHPRQGALKGRLMNFGSVSTTTEMSTAERLSLIAESFAMLVQGFAREELVIEVEEPSTTRMYWRREEKGPAAAGVQRGLAQLNMSIGALVGSAAGMGYQVRLRHPNSRSKRERWDKVKLALGRSVEGRTNPEERDALALGVQILSHSSRAWAPAPENHVLLDLPVRGKAAVLARKSAARKARKSAQREEVFPAALRAQLEDLTP